MRKVVEALCTELIAGRKVECCVLAEKPKRRKNTRKNLLLDWGIILRRIFEN